MILHAVTTLCKDQRAVDRHFANPGHCARIAIGLFIEAIAGRSGSSVSCVFQPRPTFSDIHSLFCSYSVRPPDPCVFSSETGATPVSCAHPPSVRSLWASFYSPSTCAIWWLSRGSPVQTRGSHHFLSSRQCATDSRVLDPAAPALVVAGGSTMPACMGNPRVQSCLARVNACSGSCQ